MTDKYYYKYLKYKHKYLNSKYYNKIGGGISNLTREKVINDTLVPPDNHLETRTYLSSIDKHLNIQPKSVIIKGKNNLCLTAPGDKDGKYDIRQRFIMKDCDNNENQEFNVEEIKNNAFLLSSKKRGVGDKKLCVDIQGADRILHTYECAANNQNQQWIEVDEFKNIDAENGHIIANIQSLIFAYPDRTNINDDDCTDDLFSEANIVAGFARQLYSQDNVINSTTTLSKVFCPIIWNALSLLGVKILSSWTKYYIPSKQPQIDQLSNRLAKIPGWKNYTLQCLRTDFKSTQFPNESTNDLTIKLAHQIKNELLLDNKLY